MSDFAVNEKNKLAPPKTEESGHQTETQKAQKAEQMQKSLREQTHQVAKKLDVSKQADKQEDAGHHWQKFAEMQTPQNDVQQAQEINKKAEENMRQVLAANMARQFEQPVKA